MLDLDAFAAYLDRHPKLAPSTAQVYMRTVRRIPDDVHPLDWLQEQVTERTPDGTRAQLRGACMAAARCLAGREDIEAPPLARRRKRVRYGRTPLRDEDLERYHVLVDESGIPCTSRAILRLLPWTGLRIGELCSVMREDVQLRARGADPPGVDVVGKGNKSRWIPLLPEARGLLRDYLAEAREEGLDTATWIFPALRGDGHASPTTVRAHLREIRGGLPRRARDVTPHVLRHTVATRLQRAGVDLDRIQTILGHADVRTTQLYLHPDKGAIAEAFGRLA